MQPRRLLLPLLVIWSLSAVPCMGQQGEWRTYTTKDGLLDDALEVYNVHVDPEGQVWFITDRGVNVFDGASWRSYTEKNGLIGRKISCSLLDSKGRIWVGSYTNELGDGGISIFDEGEWRSYRRSEGFFKAAHPRLLVEDPQGRVWVATSTIPGSYTAGMAASALSGVTPFAGLVYSGLVLAVSRSGLSMFSNDTWTNFDKVGPEPPFDYVRRLVEDKKGRVWFTTDKDKLFCYDGHAFIAPSAKEGYVQCEIRDIMVDSRKNLWIASQNRVMMYDGDRWTVFKMRVIGDLLALTSLRIHEDRKGEIIVTGMEGIAVYDGSKWRSFDLENKGAYSPSDMETYHSMFDANGDLWVYWNNNFGHYDGATWKQVWRKLDSRFYIDKHDRIWVPGKKGLEVHRDGKWETFKEYRDIYGFVEDGKGNVWGGSNDGLLYFDGVEMDRLGAGSGIPSSRTRFVTVDAQGNVWVGTDAGISRFQYADQH